MPSSTTTVEETTSCVLCGGSGWVIVADGGAGTAAPCDCRKRGRIADMVGLCGVPDRYLRCTFDSFSTSLLGAERQLGAALATCRRYVEDFLGTDGQFRETGLLFVGPPGGGKTHLAVATLLELVRSYGVRGRFVDFTSLVHQIQATFDNDSPESKQAVLGPVVEAELLVIDELGAQRPTPWVNDLLYLVLNTRYGRRRPTLFTTNYRLAPVRRELRSSASAVAASAVPPELLTSRTANELHHAEAARQADGGRAGQGLAPELLENRLPPALFSRLFEMADEVRLEVDDYRRTRASREQQHRVQRPPARASGVPVAAGGDVRGESSRPAPSGAASGRQVNVSTGTSTNSGADRRELAGSGSGSFGGLSDPPRRFDPEMLPGGKHLPLSPRRGSPTPDRGPRRGKT